MTHVQEFGALAIDRDAHRVTLDGVQVKLTRAQYRLLCALADQPGIALTNQELLTAMWGTEWTADTTPLQVHVSRLRRSLGESAARPHFIVTLHGYGYRFDSDGAYAGGTDSDPSAAGGGGASNGHQPTVSALVGLDRTIVWVSDNVAELLGWSPEALIGRDLRDLVAAEDVPGPAVLADLYSGRARVLEGKAAAADGGHRQLRVSIRPILDSTGKVSGFLHAWQPEGEAGGPEAMWPIVMSGAQPVPQERARVILTYDRDLNVVDMSPRVTLCGWEPDAILGTVFSLAGHEPNAMRAVVDDLTENGVTQLTAVVGVQCRDGSVIPAHFDVVVDVDDDGSFAGYRILLEITASALG